MTLFRIIFCKTLAATRLALLFTLLFSFPCSLLANTTMSEEQEKLVKSLSFIYAPLLGTGYYTAGAEKAFVLKLSMDSLLPEKKTDARHRWLLPVTLGVRKTDFEAILEQGLPDELHSLSLMPGVAWDFQPHSDWIVVPSIQAGLAHDFSLDTTVAIYSANLRGLGSWSLGQHTLSWGNRARAVGQYNSDTNMDQGFVLLETGLNLELAPVVKLGDRKANFSVYTQFQSYLPDIGIKGFTGERIDTRNLVHLGVSINLKKPVTILGFPFQSAGISLVRGDELKAVSFNLGFPLFRD